MSRSISHFVSISLALSFATSLVAFANAEKDPGVRQGPANAGGPISGLSPGESNFFINGVNNFAEIQSIAGTEPGATGSGLGPRYNGTSCLACHSHPTAGGTSPYSNPSYDAASEYGATNQIPFFITKDGPVREARFRYNPDGSRDGGVHDLYTVVGRADAPGCSMDQPDFYAAAAAGNLSLRIPSPVFGGGLIDEIPDDAIVANKTSNHDAKAKLGIFGHENLNGNTGTISRFGWKAQNKSLMLFAAEAYAVESGVTNDIFPTSRDETPGCTYMGSPADQADPSAKTPTEVLSDVSNFTHFMRYLAPPTPMPPSASTRNGERVFKNVGCVACHSPSLSTGLTASNALSYQKANLFSDLLVHHMGPALADYIIQGNAGSDEFRTAPLWGLGQRIFFLHDGRTSDLVEAIAAHASASEDRGSCTIFSGHPIPLDKPACASEANQVIAKYNKVSTSDKQDLLNFLRSL
jgi:CxxC motif-containing protein (DUF1111 family)